MAYEVIIFETEGPLAVVTVNRPKALNALSPQVMDELTDAFEKISTDENIRAAVITGAGRAFVAGADISAMQTYTPLQARGFAKKGHKLGEKIENCPKPVIAAVNGFCLGGGCELAMCCDFIYASEGAKFGQPEINLGIVPGFGGTQRLPRLVGKGWAKLLCMTGEMIGAQEAAAIGLVTRVFPEGEVLEAAKKTALAMCGKGMVSLRAAKQLVEQGFDLPLQRALDLEAEVFCTCFTSPDQREGMSAFLEKRKADFKGGLDK